jgi:uncharacterized protein YbjT (DUF2867 family)
MLAIIGASGQVGWATLQALLNNKLATPDSIITITSSQPGSKTWMRLAGTGVTVRHGNFEDRASLEAALQGVTKFFLISSPAAELDFNNAPEGEGREKHHKVAIDAARTVGVSHLYYTSLGFGEPSKAGVMRAHLRTEKYLATITDIKITVIREGLYTQSWPLYFGYYDIKTDTRSVVPVAADGKVSWTDVNDLGLGSAIVLTDPSEDWAGKTFYLSSPPEYARTLQEISGLISKIRGQPVKLDVVGLDRHMKYYVDELKMDHASVDWWLGSFEAIGDGETLIDDPTLAKLLERKGKKPTSMEEILAIHDPNYDPVSILRSNLSKD